MSKSIQKEIEKMIDKVYGKNSIEFMFDSEQIKKDLILKVGELLLQERQRTLEEVLRLPQGEIITPITVKGYKVIRVVDVDALSKLLKSQSE